MNHGYSTSTNEKGIGEEKTRLFHFFFHFSTHSYLDVSV